jgi:hypothetical protein
MKKLQGWLGQGPKRVRWHKARLDLEVLEDRSLPSVSVFGTAEGISASESSCGCQPPDTDAAAGPDILVETVNLAIAYYDKGTGTRLALRSLQSFFSPVAPIYFISDPVVTYDEMAGRFFVGILDIDTVGRHGYFDFAVSDDADPRDGWTSIYKLDITQTNEAGQIFWGDYPKLGFNADAFFVTLNMKPFPLSSGSEPDHAQILAIDKASVLKHDPNILTVYNSDRPGPGYAMAAATMHDTMPGDPMYFVREDTRFGGDHIRVVQMTDVLSMTPTYVEYSIPVAAYQRPPVAVHPGGTIQTFESVILNADWRNGRLVATHHVGSGGITRARWYEFDTSGNTPSLTQSGEIDQGVGVYTYFEAIAVADNGDLGMTFMESSAKEFVTMYVTGQQAGDPAGTMQTPIATHIGGNRYLGFRGGDYSGLTQDPVDGTFWAASMYKPASSQFWGTGLANFALASDSAGAQSRRASRLRPAASSGRGEAAALLWTSHESAVAPRLEEVDAVFHDEIPRAMLLRDAPRPDFGTETRRTVALPFARERIVQPLQPLQDPQLDLSVLFDLRSQVFLN